MQLESYLRVNEIPVAKFASRIGVKRAASVYRYLRKSGDPDRRIPEPEVMQRIYEETGGQVTANDFYGTPINDPPPTTNGKHATKGAH